METPCWTSRGDAPRSRSGGRMPRDGDARFDSSKAKERPVMEARGRTSCDDAPQSKRAYITWRVPLRMRCPQAGAANSVNITYPTTGNTPSA